MKYNGESVSSINLKIMRKYGLSYKAFKTDHAEVKLPHDVS